MVERISDADLVFRALGDPTRRKMIEALSQREHSVSELAEPFAMTLAGASKHVGILEEAGLLKRERRGRERVCTLNTDPLLAARDWVDRYAGFWSDRLDALEQALKENGGE